MTVAASPEILSRRELGKAERRRRIVEAAISLVREHGYDDVSMVQIAERADVSPATLYNLFQTKGAIYKCVFDLDIEKYQELVSEAPAHDALDRMFAAIDIAAELFHRDAQLYRALGRAILGKDGTEPLRPAMAKPRVAFWQAQVAAAIAEKRLRADTDANLLGLMLAQMMGATMMDWTAHVISTKRLAAEATYGFALLLLAYATPKTASQLRQRAERLKKSLSTTSRADRRM